MSPRKRASITPLGNFIIRRRKNLGWNTADLASKAELSYSTVRNIEKGYSRKPTETILRALARTLESDEGVLFAYAGYGTIPLMSQEVRDAHFDALGERAPRWRDAIEQVKQTMTPDEQDQALAILEAQIEAVKSRRRKDRP